jgi:hypothetical protein
MTYELRLKTKLYNLLERLDLSYDEAEHALSLYAHNKRFDKELDAHYNVDNDTIDEDWDEWHPNDL